MNIRLAILAPEAAKYQGYAEQELYKLEAIRQMNKRPSMRKVFKVGQVFILIYTTPLIHKILMWGGATPLILISNYITSFGYDYYQDSLIDAVTPQGLETNEPLSPIFNGRSQFGDTAYITYDNSWSSGIIGNPYTFLGKVNTYEMGMFYSGSSVFGRVGESVGTVAHQPPNFLPNLSHQYGPLFSLIGYTNQESWNLLQPATSYLFNPSSAAVSESWHWLPSFFTVQPNDGFGLTPGFYYGHYPNAVHEVETESGVAKALTSADVSLRAVLETNYRGGLYQYGWCEQLKTIDSEEVNTLYFYLQSSQLSVYGNSTFGYYSISGTVEDMTITTGADLSGFPSALSIDVTDSDAEVEMWNFQIWTDPTTLIPQQDSGVGIKVVDGQTVTFYRFTGFLAQVYATDSYHSHSISNDGKILAVFESTSEGLITSVNVFDLYGTREATQGAEYTGGGFTVLRQSEVVATASGTTACIIPYREADFEPVAINYPLYNAPVQTIVEQDTNYMSSMAMVRFFKRGTAAPIIRKVTCTNGVDAHYGVSVDSCFDSVFVLEDPDLGVKEERLTGWWDGGGNFKGVVRGSYTGSHPDMRFQGEGVDEFIFTTVTRPDELSFLNYEDGSFDVGNSIGDIIPGICVEEATEGSQGQYTVPASCLESCDGSNTESVVTSSCGQEGRQENEIPVPSDLTISYTGGIYVTAGEFVSSSGGVGDVVYSMDCGSIDSSTGEILSISGCCQATVTATDDCGRTATLELIKSGGYYSSPPSYHCKTSLRDPLGAGCSCQDRTPHQQITTDFYAACEFSTSTWPDLFACSGCLDLSSVSCNTSFINYGGCGDGSEVVITEQTINEWACT